MFNGVSQLRRPERANPGAMVGGGERLRRADDVGQPCRVYDQARRPAGVGRGVINIDAPLQHVAMNVVQAPRVRQPLRDRVGVVAGVMGGRGARTSRRKIGATGP